LAPLHTGQGNPFTLENGIKKQHIAENFNRCEQPATIILKNGTGYDVVYY